MLQNILRLFDLDPASHEVKVFGPGLINHTFRVTGPQGDFILQQVNHNVFKKPEDIAANLQQIGLYLKQHFPNYLFEAPLPTTDGDTMVHTSDGKYYRLFRFVPDSHTIDVVNTPKQAYEAAAQFGRFSRLLANFDAGQLKATIPGFHNLQLRFRQLQDAINGAPDDRKNAAMSAIQDARLYGEIARTHHYLTDKQVLPLRVIHHDTKISNVLFDRDDNGLCVIDLDTVMPGYYLSDTGDMLRTYLSPVNEEEEDLSKISINLDYFKAIYKGYMSQMGDVLIPTEKEYFIFSGKMMMYMQALRFLADYLNNDIYYGSAYPGHNLKRAQNQFTLLTRFYEAEPEMQAIMDEAGKF